MAPIAPGALAESASAKMRFLYSAEYWRRLALTTTSGSGIVLASPGATLRSASLRSASLRSAPGEAKTTEGGGTPFTDFFMSISFSALYTKSRKGRRLTDLGTEGGRLDAALPSAVRGPVDFLAFSRLALIWASVGVRGSFVFFIFVSAGAGGPVLTLMLG